MQSITVNEFIPTLTGENVPAYDGYKPWVNGRLALEFVASLYRLGHTLLPRELQRYGSPGGHNPLPSLDLGESLFQSPALFQTSADLDALMRGFIRQPHEKLDCVVADGVRNTLVVDEPGTAGVLFDLPAINIERGRELGLPTYNQARAGFGLPPVAHFSDTFDAKAAGRLSSIYPNTEPDRPVRGRHLREGRASGPGPHRPPDHRRHPAADQGPPRRGPLLVRERPDAGRRSRKSRATSSRT